MFTGGCNLRCPFCHNGSIVCSPTGGEFSEEEIFTYLKKRRGILDGLVVSGGEPMLQADLPDFLQKVKELGYLVKLDTNGSFPEKLKEIIDKGLVDYAAMDIKNCKARYGETVGKTMFDIMPILKSVELLKTGQLPFEFRTTLVRGLHDRESLIALAEWIAPIDRYYMQNFVDSGDLIDSESEGFSKEETEAFLTAVQKIIPTAEIRGL